MSGMGRNIYVPRRSFLGKEGVAKQSQLSQFPLKTVHVYTPIDCNSMMPPFFSFEALAIAEIPLDNASNPAHISHQGFINHLACPLWAS